MRDAGGSGRVEHVRGAVHVDVVHPVLVADRVEDEGEVHERIRALLGDQGGNAAVTDVHVHEAGARSGHGRGADVEVHDLVFLVLDQQIGEAAADVAGPTGDQVLHRSHPLSGTGAKPTSKGVEAPQPVAIPVVGAPMARGCASKGDRKVSDTGRGRTDGPVRCLWTPVARSFGAWAGPPIFKGARSMQGIRVRRGPVPRTGCWGSSRPPRRDRRRSRAPGRAARSCALSP